MSASPLDVHPTSVAEMARTIVDASASGSKVTPVGGGTHLALGRSAAAPDVVLHTGALDRVVEHEPDDMTISVEAGITVAALRMSLDQAGCRLPLDVEHPDRSTVGGMVAFGAVGPRRFGQGTLRERLIGARCILSDGTVVKTGGMVVKNVSGYDLTRMLHGSMGALGVVVSANFKLSPLPAARSFDAFDFEHAGDAIRAAEDLVATRLPFAGVHALSEGRLVVGSEGHPADVRRLRSEARAAATRRGGSERVAIDDSAKVEAAWSEFQAAPFGDGTATFRIASTPSKVSGDVARASACARQLGFGPAWSIDAGCGTADMSVEAARAESIAALEAGLIEAMPAVRVTRCPLALRSALVLDGRQPAGMELMRLLRSAFDPGATFLTGPFANAPASRG